MKYVKLKKIAEQYDISEKTLRQLCLLGKIPGAVRIPGTKEWRVPADAFEKFIKQNQKETA